FVQVYEDEHSSDDNNEIPPETSQLSVQTVSQVDEDTPASSQPSSSSGNENFSDPDEENDPVVHSFGPFGDNILPRMAAFTAGGSPNHSRRQHLKSRFSPQRRSSSESTNDADPSPLSNHVINQLAFSRLSSTPLSTIMNNL